MIRSLQLGRKFAKGPHLWVKTNNAKLANAANALTATNYKKMRKLLRPKGSATFVKPSVFPL